MAGINVSRFKELAIRQRNLVVPVQEGNPDARLELVIVQDQIANEFPETHIGKNLGTQLERDYREQVVQRAQGGRQ